MIRVKFTLILALVVLLLIGIVSTTGCSKKDQSVAPSLTVPGASGATSGISQAPTTGPSSVPVTSRATSGISQAPTTGPSSVPSPATTGSAVTLIKLKTISYIDQQGIGTEAFKMLIPSDWQFEGGIRWVLDNPTMPAITQFRVWNPKGTEEFRVFPNQAFFWTDNPLTEVPQFHS